MSKKRYSVRDELREKFPGLCQKADYGRSPMSAIRLNCTECNGGNSRLAADCETYDCFLWPYRHRKADIDARPDGYVPSLDEYAARLAEWWRARGMDPEEKAAQLIASTHGARTLDDDDDVDVDDEE